MYSNYYGKPQQRCKKCVNGRLKISYNRFLDFSAKSEICPICDGTGWVDMTEDTRDEGDQYGNL